MAYVGLEGFNRDVADPSFYDSYEGGSPYRDNPYQTNVYTQQKNNQGNMPSMNSIKNLMGDGGGGAVATAVPSTAAEAGTLQGMGLGGAGGEGAIAGGSTAAGAGAGGGGMLSAGWIGAIIAAIYANETYAEEHGYRADTKRQRGKDFLSGENFTTDLSQRIFPKLGAGENNFINKAGTVIGAPLTFDWEESKQRWMDLFK